MSGRPDISQYGRTVYSVVYVAVNRCAIIIQIMCYAVKGVKTSHYIQNFKRQNSTNAEKFFYLLGHLMKKNQRHKNLCQRGTNYCSKKFCPTWAEFSKPTSRQLVGNIKRSLPLKLVERKNPTSDQFGQKWEIQLRHNLCRSHNYFYVTCREVGGDLCDQICYRLQKEISRTILLKWICINCRVLR